MKKLFLLGIMFLFSCAYNQEMIISTDSALMTQIIHKNDIVILPLGVKTYSTSNNNLQIDNAAIEEFLEFVIQLTEDNFSSKNNSITNFTPSESHDNTNKYFNYFGSKNIFSKNQFLVNNSVYPSVICTVYKQSLLIAHSIVIKLGKAGYWNPIGGAIGADTSSSHYRLAIFDCELNKRIWVGSVFFRKSANTSNIRVPINKLHSKLIGVLEDIK